MKGVPFFYGKFMKGVPFFFGSYMKGVPLLTLEGI